MRTIFTKRRATLFFSYSKSSSTSVTGSIYYNICDEYMTKKVQLIYRINLIVSHEGHLTGAGFTM